MLISILRDKLTLLPTQTVYLPKYMNTYGTDSVSVLFQQMFTYQFEAVFIWATVHHNIENSAAYRLNQNKHFVEAGCFTSAQVVVPNSQQTSCLDGSFLECSLPTREARVLSPGGTCQSQDL